MNDAHYSLLTLLVHAMSVKRDSSNKLGMRMSESNNQFLDYFIQKFKLKIIF